MNIIEKMLSNMRLFTRMCLLVCLVVLTVAEQAAPHISDPWHWLGPFSVAVGERGVDAHSFETAFSNHSRKLAAGFEHTNTLPRPDKTSFATELVPGGKVGWTKVCFFKGAR